MTAQETADKLLAGFQAAQRGEVEDQSNGALWVEGWRLYWSHIHGM